MPEKTARENILTKIKKALAVSTEVPFSAIEKTASVYTSPQQDTEIIFAENFTKLGGIFSYCGSEQELKEQLTLLITKKQWEKIYCIEDALLHLLRQNEGSLSLYPDLSTCSASITSCELLIARTGSIVLSSAQQHGRTASVYAPIHICIAYTNQLVYHIQEGLQLIKQKYKGNLPSFITFAAGPSRTADIEKTLVVGVHGPKEVYVFLVEK